MILCCGEALIDMIPKPTALGRDGFVPHCGGGALNTAISLANMGACAGLLAAVSRDMFGALLLKGLGDAGVDRSLIIPTHRPTTLAFVHLEAQEARYSFYDDNSAGRMLRPADLPELPEKVRCLLLGGISLCHPPGADAFEALGKMGDGRLIMLDPNIRPAFVTDETVYRARLGRMTARTDILKLSEPDLDWLDPRPAGQVPWADKLNDLLRAGPALILFTQGARGAVACHRDGRRVAVSAQKVRVDDTVGAGDAFNAGFLARLEALGRMTPDAVARIETSALRDCMTHANRAAVASLSRSGGA